jgi:lysophospholipase L1-like esterase
VPKERGPERGLPYFQLLKRGSTAPVEVDIYPKEVKSTSDAPTEGQEKGTVEGFFRRRVFLVLASVVVATVIFATWLELRERAAYIAWRAERARSLARDGVVTASNDAQLVWENRPGAASGRIAINRWGFRDYDYPTVDKPTGAVRIAFVGDSVTLGGNVDAPELFVSRIGQRLQSLQCQSSVQTMNFSVSGYNTLQIEELISVRVLPFSPDQVLYVLCLNDFDFEDASGQLFRFFRPPLSFAWERLTRFPDSPDPAEYHSRHFTKNGERVFGSIRRISQALAAKKIEFRVLLMPVFDFAAPSFQAYSLRTMHAGISTRLQGEGIKVTDLMPDFRDCTSRPPSAFARDVWHLNSLGHQFVAEALPDALFPVCPDRSIDGREKRCTKLRSLEQAANAGDRENLDVRLSSGARVRLEVGSPLLQLDGFWPIEESPKTAYAWSRDASTITVSGLRQGRRYIVDLEVLDSAGRQSISVLPSGGDTSEVAIRDSTAHAGELAADNGGTVSLGVKARTWRPSDRGSSDIRELGVAISGVVVQVTH